MIFDMIHDFTNNSEVNSGPIFSVNMYDVYLKPQVNKHWEWVCPRGTLATRCCHDKFDDPHLISKNFLNEVEFGQSNSRIN